MYFDEFKIWLEGYLEAVGIEKIEELEEAELTAIVKKMSEVKERPLVDFQDPFESRILEWHPWSNIRGAMPRFRNYIEKLSYTDSEGNRYEYENRDGEEKVKTNMETTDKLTERARSMVGDTLKKIAG